MGQTLSDPASNPLISALVLGASPQGGQNLAALQAIPLLRAEREQKMGQINAYNDLVKQMAPESNAPPAGAYTGTPAAPAMSGGAPTLADVPPMGISNGPQSSPMAAIIRAMGPEALPSLYQTIMTQKYLSNIPGLSDSDKATIMATGAEGLKALAARNIVSPKDRYATTRNGSVIDLANPNGGGPSVAVQGVPEILKGFMGGREQPFMANVGGAAPTPFGGPGPTTNKSDIGMTLAELGGLGGSGRVNPSLPGGAPFGAGAQGAMPSLPGSAPSPLDAIRAAAVSKLSMTPQQQAAATKSAEEATQNNYKLRDTISEQATKADEEVPLFNLATAARKVYTGGGWGGEMKGEALKAVQSLVPQGVLDKMQGGDKAAAYQVIQAIAAKQASDLRSQGQRVTQQEIMQLYLPAAGGAEMSNNAALALFPQRIANLTKWQKLRDVASNYTDDNGELKPGFYKAVQSGFNSANLEQQDIVKRTSAAGFNMGAKAIPSEAAAMLKSNPKLATQFDAKYGAGASKSVLGGQ